MTNYKQFSIQDIEIKQIHVLEIKDIQQLHNNSSHKTLHFISINILLIFLNRLKLCNSFEIPSYLQEPTAGLLGWNWSQMHLKNNQYKKEYLKEQYIIPQDVL